MDPGAPMQPVAGPSRTDVTMSPQAPPATGAQRGVFDRIKDFLGIEAPPAEEDSATLRGDPWLDELAAAVAAPPRRLRGRVAVHSAELLVIEVFADGAPLVWATAGEARITLANGQVVVARIDARRTTKKGIVAAFAAARLALVLPAGASVDVVQTIQIELDGATVSIAV